jgi:MinD-like ATPase involved in chromosome partitioning or flagellar assembly
MTSAQSTGKILTFYSYKGGTGRSMALANVAWILASSGKRVLTVDWDLEAPGLHRYFYPFLMDRDLTSSEGVIDFVNEFADAAMTPLEKDTELPKDWYIPYSNILQYATSLKWDFPGDGRLDFIPAGRQGVSYASRVTTFSWPNFYERLGGGVLIEAAKKRMLEAYDYILIDSRTGVSDTSGICTVQLPDVLVVCFTMNNQSIEGASAVANSVYDQRARDGVRVFPVPMRVEMGEKEKLQVRRNYAHTKFLRFPGHLNKDEREQYWGEVEVLYVPYYAYEEILASFSDTRQEFNSVLASAVRLTSYLTNGEVKESAPIEERARARVLAEYARQPLEINLAEEQAQAAESLFTHLAAQEQEATRRFFTRLVRPTRSDEVGKETLLRVFINEFNSVELKVLNDFSYVHLVAIEQNGEGEPQTVKIADEALLRGWKRLQDWIIKDRDFLLWRQQLKTSIKDWENNNRDKGALLSGELLAKAKGWRERRGDELNEAEKHYLDESVLAESVQITEAEKFIATEKQHDRWRIFNRATVFVLLLILAISGYAIWRVNRQATEREEEVRRNLKASVANYQRGVNELALCDVEKDEAKRKVHLDAATKDFQEAIKLNPQYAEAYNGLGKALQKTSRDDEAIDNYSKAIELRPDFTEAYFNRGLTYLDEDDLVTKDYDQIISDFTQVINSNAVNPQSPQVPIAYNGLLET